MSEKEELEKEECGCCSHEKHHEHEHEHHHEEEHEHHHEEEHEHHHHHHHDDDDDDEEEEEVSIPKLIIAAVLFVLGLFVEHGSSLLPFAASVNPLIIRGTYIALYGVCFILAGLGVIKEAVENLFHGEFFGEEFLMGFATIGAICMGEFSEACAVMLLFQLGEFLEDLAVGKSRKSITDLMDIRVDTASVKSADGSIKTVAAESVKIGDIIVVKPGERIALDGKIVKGTSLADTSALTGESVPREICEGEEVFAGFVNNSSVIEIEVTKEFGESTVARVLEMVENAQSKKAKSQKFITRFAKKYTPIVCILAVCLAVIPSVIIISNGFAGYESVGAVWKTWIYRALELLVVSCPCALVISVPLSFFAGLGLASKNGILIKGSNYIELLSKANTVAFDKTGTLTKGVFVVTAVHVADESKISEEQLLSYAAHAEYFSNHPISKSLKTAHQEKNAECPVCLKLTDSEMEEISGHGVKCNVEGKIILAGNMRLMEKEAVQGFVPCSENDAGTIVHIAVDGWYAGHIVISDVAKEDSKSAIEKLHNTGVKNTVMLTGDSKSAAESVAALLNIDTVYSELLPQHKVEKIEELLKHNEGSGKSVVFVGDGINDAPVLTRSDVGIAMGAMGSDAAVEAADVVIMDDMPGRVADAIKISRKTIANVKQNVWFALGVKTLIMVLCATGIANMWIAVFGDVGVTLLAVLNSMRLLRNVKRK